MSTFNGNWLFIGMGSSCFGWDWAKQRISWMIFYPMVLVINVLILVSPLLFVEVLCGTSVWAATESLRPNPSRPVRLSIRSSVLIAHGIDCTSALEPQLGLSVDPTSGFASLTRPSPLGEKLQFLSSYLSEHNWGGLSYVGFLGDLSEMLSQSGMKSSEIQKAVGFMNQIFDPQLKRNWNSKQEELVSYVLGYLKASIWNHADPVFCIGGGSKAQGFYVVDRGDVDFEVAPVKSVKMEGKGGGSGQEESKWTPTGRIREAIIISGGPGISAIDVLVQILHEGTHFADYRMISKWIRANRVLAERKVKGFPDPLFSTHVRRLANKGRARVDVGFLTLLLEGRAHAIGALGLFGLIPDFQLFGILRQMSELAMGRIQSESNLQWIIKKYQLSPENLFRVSEGLWDTVVRTVREAEQRGLLSKSVETFGSPLQ